MHPAEFFQELKRQYGFHTDGEIAGLLGLTNGRVSQLVNGDRDLTARQIATFFLKATFNSRKIALTDVIRPAIEMYPIERVPSRQEAQWELLPTKGHVRNQAIRKHLESMQGIYILYDSQGCAIYAGKTEKLNIWKEMTNTFNRQRSSHQFFIVPHPRTGQSFSPAWKSPRQPQMTAVHLYNTAHYFSAYEVVPELIPKFESFVVRAFCNSLSNKKMEKF